MDKIKDLVAEIRDRNEVWKEIADQYEREMRERNEPGYAPVSRPGRPYPGTHPSIEDINRAQHLRSPGDVFTK